METKTPLSTSLKNQISITITWAKYAAIISLVNLGLSLLQLIVGFVKGIERRAIGESFAS